MILDVIGSSRSWQSLLERMRALHRMPGRKPGACALHETIAAARPALLAALQKDLGGTVLAITPTPDAAERAFADLLYYLGEERAQRVALVRSRDEAIGAIESPSERSARITLLADLADRAQRIVLAPIAAARQYVTSRAHFGGRRFLLRAGHEAGWESVQERLFAFGYTRCDVVSAVGEYAVRGGIIDLFAATAEAPVRIEFVGDAIESMRAFEIESQRSSSALGELDVVAWDDAPDSGATLFDYLPADATVVVEEPTAVAMMVQALDDERARERHTLLADERSDDDRLAELDAPHASLQEIGSAVAERAALVLPGAIEPPDSPYVAWSGRVVDSFVLECRPVEHFNRQIALFSAAVREWVAEGERVFIISTAVTRTIDLLRAAGIEAGDGAPERVSVDHGSIEAGFRIPDRHLRVLGDREIFGHPPKRVKMRAVKEGVPVTLADLRVGDYVVHAVHGIGQYLGLRTETILGATQRLPRSEVRRHRPHAGAGARRCIRSRSTARPKVQSPRLSKMGGADWARTKSARLRSAREDRRRAGRALRRARDRTRTRVRRPTRRGRPRWKKPSPTSRRPISKRRSTRPRATWSARGPMDRLVCGDVGYGKTEVADARGVQGDRRQEAGRRPRADDAAGSDSTTARSARASRAFPVRVEELSRFKFQRQNRGESSATSREGSVDVVIGTHRLLQKDVAFADLGLIVIDEEQRFGVMHKERLKEYRASVDVLTLSATPIPRTLHMSLLGVRDLSLIQTAPKNRMSIKTLVVPASDGVVQRAIAAELDRGGQVYYLHNRIESIYALRARSSSSFQARASRSATAR